MQEELINVSSTMVSVHFNRTQQQQQQQHDGKCFYVKFSCDTVVKASRTVRHVLVER